MGNEQAGMLMDGVHPNSIEGGDPYRDDHDPNASFSPYTTGPDAIARHGYDPKEVAAGMLFLHHDAQSGRPGASELAEEDKGRLNDIARKRFQMQRDYEKRQGVT
jgi:hypothetical protein